MDFYEANVVKSYRLYLLLVGVWPYEYSKANEMQRIVYVTCVISFLLVQFKEFFDYIRIDLSKLTETEKILIKRTYKKCSYYCQIIFLFCYFVAFVLMIIQVFQIVDYETTSRTNRTNYFDRIILTEYFIDREKYSYPIYIHLNVAILLVCSMEIGTDVLHAIIITHIIGIFDKIGYLTIHLFDEPEITCQKIDKHLIYCRRLVYIVNLYKRNLKFCKKYNSTMVICGAIQLIWGTLIISALLLKLRNELLPHNLRIMFIYCFFVSLYLFIIYMLILPYQKVYEISETLFFKAYCGHWYSTSAKTQKLLLFLMHRFMTPYKFRFKNVVIVVDQTYLSMIRIGFSYFMFVHSIQE
ncbi:hypothetical protein HZU73_03369 [Apis mellifera caucasica]|uniref:Odorant receptor n=1 Tax=Apis mellifera TaxID=7460 RepID=A0A7M7MNG5_APIME|nr:uncharacterized protein LOC100578400 [Apis mellifera]KAG6801248.1 hypothetical protein HZU73_03369 [Apis mellifera caucasica]KAG9431207.1 hypothetical protein HZU67_07182 [Apis mellifera carnica]|eukprot:XP_026298565.1 uncharacterized protein LOC100578400 [Apis mellifera]